MSVHRWRVCAWHVQKARQCSLKNAHGEEGGKGVSIKTRGRWGGDDDDDEEEEEEEEEVVVVVVVAVDCEAAAAAAAVKESVYSEPQDEASTKFHCALSCHL